MPYELDPGPKGGAPALVFTETEIKQIRQLAGLLTLQQLADFYDIDIGTFNRMLDDHEEVATAVRKGLAGTIAQVAGTLVRTALAGHVGAMTEYLRVKGGWSQKNTVELSGPGGKPLAVDMTVHVEVARDAVRERLKRLQESRMEWNGRSPALTSEVER